MTQNLTTRQVRSLQCLQAQVSAPILSQSTHTWPFQSKLCDFKSTTLSSTNQGLISLEPDLGRVAPDDSSPSSKPDGAELLTRSNTALTSTPAESSSRVHDAGLSTLASQPSTNTDNPVIRRQLQISTLPRLPLFSVSISIYRSTTTSEWKRDS